MVSLKPNSRKWTLLAVASAAVALAACTGSPAEQARAVGSSFQARSLDKKLVYTVDPDKEVVIVEDAKTERRVAQVKVGRAPEHVVVGPDETLYVSNRGARSVSVIAPGQWTEVRRLEVGVEPVGLAVSPDNQTLYVVNASSLDRDGHGSLSAVELKTAAVKWNLKLGEDPHVVQLVDERNALVSFYRKARAVRVDLERVEIIRELAQGPARPAGHGG
jgi:DNA-binding beta-propeller fold protein YncE